jgi:hypothetical protein
LRVAASLFEKSGQVRYEKLDAQSREAYAGLDHEAYVNRALTERAHGTAGDGIATIRQRGESNLRNTLGKNERQRQSFEGSVDLALKNYETRQAADDAALSAQYGAAENAALVSPDLTELVHTFFRR